MEETTRPTWDQTFLALAKEVAKRSKDPSTKVGAVIVGPDHEIRSMGYNCFPRGVNDSAPKRLERPLKYKWVEHSERNAIFNAARVGIPLKGCSMVISWLPCSDCVRAIIQSGIVSIVVDDISIPSRWREDFVVSMTMLREAGIKICRPDSVNNYLDPFDILWKGMVSKRDDGLESTILWVRSEKDGFVKVAFMRDEYVQLPIVIKPDILEASLVNVG